MKIRSFAFLPLSFSARVIAQYQFYNLTTAATNLSSTCIAVLNQAVNCDTSVAWAGQGRYEEDATLEALCTTTCAAALTTWLRRAAGACTSRYVDREGKAILPAYWVEAVVENYNLVCLQNGYVFGTTYSSELDLTIT